MSSNTKKLQSKADDYIGSGKLPDAIDCYKQIIAEEPTDTDTLMKVAALLGRVDNKPEAIEYFLKAADLLEKKGSLTKAITACKQALQIDYRNVTLYRRLAVTYVKLGLPEDALAQFKSALAILEEENRIEQSLDISKEMLQHDPANLHIRAGVVAALCRIGQEEKAQQLTDEVSARLQGENREDDLIDFYERMVTFFPNSAKILQILARSYVSRYEPVKALLKIKDLLKNKVQDEVTLSLLAEAYKQVGKNDKAIPVLKELARIYHKSRNKDKIIFICHEILGLDPTDAQARKALNKLGIKTNLDAQPKTN
jgi:tetratricopeptide (TPR) repeat protein